MSPRDMKEESSEIEIFKKEGEYESSEGDELTKGGGETVVGRFADEEENWGDSLTRVIDCSSLSVCSRSLSCGEEERSCDEEKIEDPET